MTRAEMAERRANIADLYATGEYTMQEVGELCGGITPSRVSQIVRRAKLDAEHKRCARARNRDLVQSMYAEWAAAWARIVGREG